MADARCGQGKRRVSQQELPEDVLAGNVFARLPVNDLLSIRPTCKLWNRLVLSDPRIPDGSALDACFLLLLKPHEPRWRTRDPTELHKKVTEWRKKNKVLVIVHRPVQNEWYPTPRPWKGLPDEFRPDSGNDGHNNVRVRFQLEDVEGPFLFYKIYGFVRDEFRDPGGWCVLNPVSQGSWSVPPLNPDVSHVNYYNRRKAKLIQTTDASGKTRWNVVMLTIAVPEGTGPLQGRQGFIYTHVCDRSWKLVHTTEMRNHRAWPGMRSWEVEAVFSHGRFAIFVLKSDHKARRHTRRLWAFDSVEESGTHIDVPEIVSPSLHFVSCYGYVFAIASGNDDRSILSFYKHSSVGSLPSKVEGCWSKVFTFQIQPDRCPFISCTAVNHCIYVATYKGIEMIYNVLDETMHLVPDYPKPRKFKPDYFVTKPMCFRPSKVAEFMSSE